MASVTESQSTCVRLELLPTSAGMLCFLLDRPIPSTKAPKPCPPSGTEDGGPSPFRADLVSALTWWNLQLKAREPS